MELLIVKDNEKLGLDNTKLSYLDLINKTQGELHELKGEAQLLELLENFKRSESHSEATIKNYIDKAIEETKERLADESWDVLQMMVAIQFMKLNREGIKADRSLKRHNEKLIGRKWNIEGTILMLVGVEDEYTDEGLDLLREKVFHAEKK